ncbi:MAG TPA: nitroreductase family deazaflavin-dependent oxidoreductase, partial [Ktedonobacteraceae bacterium]
IENKQDQDKHDIMVVERIQADELREPGTVRQVAEEASNRGKKKVPVWARWLGKWLIIVYRFHLGWLVGHRFMLITHRGRRTGKVRQTGVMVLHYDRQSREALVAAGSANADWYRNIHASPAIEVALGRERYRPEQRFLEVEEIAELLAWSRQWHPVKARIQSMFFHWPWGTSKKELLDLARSLGGVAFRPGQVDSSDR